MTCSGCVRSFGFKSNINPSHLPAVPGIIETCSLHSKAAVIHEIKGQRNVFLSEITFIMASSTARSSVFGPCRNLLLTMFTMCSYNVSRTNGVWSTSTVLRILEDQRYIGTYVIGKRKVKEIGSRHTQLKDESEWFKIPNHHPATQNCHRKWTNHFPTRCLKLLYPKVVISRVVPSGLRA